MSPMAGDIIVEGKRGLDAFPGTTLEAELRANKVENLVLAGFLTNCCVESTMRTAFEKARAQYPPPLSPGPRGLDLRPPP
eukprot:1643207-Prymnesium_polylepis.1